MSTNFVRLGLVIAGSVAVLSACAVMPGAAAPVGAASQSIEPPQSERVMTLTASGVQTYSCEYDAQHRLGWVFKSPQAILFDTSGHATVRHAAGPSWEAQDGSRIVGKVIAQKPSDTPASVPQVLLETHSTATSGVLSAVRYVQRVKTVGGVMPSAPCSTEHDLGNSPYLADYVFYK